MSERKKSRLDARLQDFRTWWLGLSEEARARNGQRLKAMGEVATQIMEDTSGEDFGSKFWGIIAEAGKAFFFFGREPVDLLLTLKEGIPEVWPAIGPFLSEDLRAQLAAKEANRG